MGAVPGWFCPKLVPPGTFPYGTPHHRELGSAMERVLYAQNMYQWGGSWVLILPRDLREALQLRPGDLIIMRRHGPFVTFRRGIPDQIVPISEFHLEDLPPRWPKAGKDAEAGNHPEGKAATSAKPDAGKDG